MLDLLGIDGFEPGLPATAIQLLGQQRGRVAVAVVVVLAECARGIVETTPDNSRVFVPRRPARNGVMHEHQTGPVVAEAVDDLALRCRRLDQLDRGIGVGEAQSGHVVEHDHVVTPRGLRRPGPFDVVDRPGDRVEDREKRFSFEGMTAGHDQNLQQTLRARHRRRCIIGRRMSTRP